MLKAIWQNLSIEREPSHRSVWLLFLIGIIIVPYSPISVIPIVVGLGRLCWLYRLEIIQTRFNWVLVILSLGSIAISSFSVNLWESLGSTLNIIPFFLFFATHRYLFDRPQKLILVARAIVLASLPIVILGFGQLWGGWDILLKSGSFELINVRPYGIPPGRMSSLFVYTSVMATYLQAVFIFCLGLWVDTLKEIDLRTRKISLEFWVLTGYLAILLLALILTSSRTAWMVAIVAIIAMTIYQKWYWLLGSIAAIVSLIFGAAFAPDPARTGLRQIVPAYFWARINDSMYPNRPTVDTRESLFQFAWQLTLDRPLTGWGLQTFGNLYRDKTGFYLNHPHNIFLSLSYGIGIPMTAFFIITIGYIFYVPWRFWIELPPRWHSARTIVFTYLLAAAGFVIMNITDLTLFMLPMNFFFWVILTALYGLATTRD
jgi:O-antigen ligase